MKALIIGILLHSIAFSAIAKMSPHDAARQGDLKTLRQYRFEGENLYHPDTRGFTPYELAAIHANVSNAKNLRKHVETMLWLKELNAKKHRYGKATIKFIQAGLKSLGYNIKRPDGLLGKKTIAEIKRYQKQKKLATTGKPGPQWLGIFYRDVLRNLQKKLTLLGYNTNGNDGLMGKTTRSAMLKYRRTNHLSNPSYRYVDALIINSVNNQLARKKRDDDKIAKAEADKKNKDRLRYIQAGLSLSGYPIGKIDGFSGKRTTDAVKKFQKLYQVPVTGVVNDKTRHLMDTVFLKNTQKGLTALGYKIGKADGKMGKRTKKAIVQFNKKHKITQSSILTSEMMIALRHQNQLAKRRATEAKKKRLAAETKKKQLAAKAKAKRLATETKKKQLLADAKAKRLAAEAKKKQLATEAAERKQLVALAEKKRLAEAKKKRLAAEAEKKRLAKLKKQKASQDVIQLKKQKKTAISMSKNNKHRKGNSAKGNMRFTRKGGRVIGCRLAGRNIPIEWCEPFYPLPKKNHCKASFSSTTGAVTNLWCR